TWSSNVLKPSPSHHPISFEQLPNPIVQRAPGFKTRLAQSLIRDDVVALIRIRSDLGKVHVKIGHVLLDLQRQLFLGKVGGVQAGIIGSPRHSFKVLDTMDKTSGHVADMDVITLKVLLEDN